MRKCKECGTKYEPTQSFQSWCSPECGVKIARKRQEKAAETKRKGFNRDTRKRKEKLKTRSDWLKEAQKECNKYIRVRDQGKPCVSCGRPDDGSHQRHASHFRPQGNCSPLRFHEMNINTSCSRCNNHLSGNLIPYKEKLIEMYGSHIVDWIESQNHPYTWEIEDIKQVKAYFRNKCKELENGTK